jgi:DNA-binding transcriptional ArsR family regulator
VLDVKAKFFRGLADLSRLSILEALRRGPRNVSEVVRMTGLLQPNASTHLNCLWDCGLVDREVRGRCRYYQIKSPGILAILGEADRFLVKVRARISECRRYEERRKSLAVRRRAKLNNRKPTYRRKQ